MRSLNSEKDISTYLEKLISRFQSLYEREKHNLSETRKALESLDKVKLRRDVRKGMVRYFIMVPEQKSTVKEIYERLMELQNSMSDVLKKMLYEVKNPMTMIFNQEGKELVTIKTKLSYKLTVDMIRSDVSRLHQREDLQMYLMIVTKCFLTRGL